MTSFDESYKTLNPAQKEAVDTIEGPLMVIAGPGTGKTQLLAMRAANILRRTDMNPNNILCLTFTESGAAAMRERLIELVGPEAYGIAVHTFHSFGSEIINRYGEYFYSGAQFRPADELSTYEVLQEIFRELPANNPLASTMNGEFTYLRDAQKAISELKRSGFTPDELGTVLERNQAFIDYATPLVREAFPGRLSKKDLPRLEKLLAHLENYDEEPLNLSGYTPLARVATSELARALEAARESGKTTELTAWRNRWCEKNSAGELVFRDEKRGRKLRALASVYYDYLNVMQTRGLYDFDDMILRVVHASEVFPDLRFDLEEQYQYIMVDEFQDTNGAQLRLLLNLTARDGDLAPNVMVVGDDDQAIYSFQGADMSNILEFSDRFPDVRVVALTDNYRSSAPILSAAREMIVKGNDRLETRLDTLDKTLTPHHKNPKSTAAIITHGRESDQFHQLARDIKTAHARGEESIAVIARNHAQLAKLTPYLHDLDIPLEYERRENVLDAPPVRLLVNVSRVLVLLGQGRFDEANASLPELLAHPAWGLSTDALWHLALTASQTRTSWLSIMRERPGELADIAAWLTELARDALTEPFEIILDHLLGSDEVQAADSEMVDSNEPFADTGKNEGWRSPLRDYFFSSTQLKRQPAAYLEYLSALTALRRALAEYRPDQPLALSDFVEFVDLSRASGSSLAITNRYREANRPVQLMTAHKSKGLEFDSVYVVSGVDQIWGARARSRHSLLPWPHNLPIGAPGTSDDERRRLLYVAMTRARNRLLIHSFEQDDRERSNELARYLLVDSLAQHTAAQPDKPALGESAEIAWHERLTRLPRGDMQSLLAPRLEHYTLSATHLNNFIDVSRGGPHNFLLQNLLRFPQSMSPSAAFGSAIHKTLQHAHQHLTSVGHIRPVEDVLGDFGRELASFGLTKRDFDYYSQKGSEVLETFLAKRYDSFDPAQRVEVSFASEGARVGAAEISGAIDVMQVDEAAKTLRITDYKTGASSQSWRGKSDYEKLKLHKYRQQLMFYQLLAESSRSFGGYTVASTALEFVEADERGEIVTLAADAGDAELERFRHLVEVAWDKIQTLDLPDTSGYEPNYKGVLAFERDLLGED